MRHIVGQEVIESCRIGFEVRNSILLSYGRAKLAAAALLTSVTRYPLLRVYPLSFTTNPTISTTTLSSWRGACARGAGSDRGNMPGIRRDDGARTGGPCGSINIAIFRRRIRLCLSGRKEEPPPTCRRRHPVSGNHGQDAHATAGDDGVFLILLAATLPPLRYPFFSPPPRRGIRPRLRPYASRQFFLYNQGTFRYIITLTRG